MSFETYLSKVRTLSRQERLQNLVEQLEHQFNGNVDQIIQYLHEQGANYHLAQELLRYFSPINHQNSPLFGQTVTSAKSVESFRVLSSIYSYKPSQRPTPRPKSDESTVYNKTPYSSYNQSNVTSHRKLNAFSSIYTPDKPKLRIETQTTCATDIFSGSVFARRNSSLEHIQKLISENDIYHALQELSQYKASDPSLKVLIASFQCYYVLRDKPNAMALCQQLMSQYPDDTVKSQVHLEMLIFYLSRILKSDHRQKITQILIQKIQGSLIIGNLTQMTKFYLLELRYKILEDQDITENIKYLAQLNSDDAKYQKDAFSKVARILYESSKSSFKSVLEILQQEHVANPDSYQSRILYFLHWLINLSSKNQNIKQFKICSNLFVGWAAKEHIIYSIKVALEVCSKSIQFLLQHFNSFSLIEQDFTLKSIFKIIQNQISRDQQCKECLYSLSIQCSKFFYGVSLERTIEFLKIALENESYPETREGGLLKFKLVQNIIQTGIKIKGFDSQKYIYEAEKIIASKFIQNQDKAIIHNELANCLQRSGQYKTAVQHYQKAVNLLSDQPNVRSKIQSNLRQCSLKIK